MGISTYSRVFRNLTPSELYEHALRRREGVVTSRPRTVPRTSRPLRDGAGRARTAQTASDSETLGCRLRCPSLIWVTARGGGTPARRRRRSPPCSRCREPRIIFATHGPAGPSPQG